MKAKLVLFILAAISLSLSSVGAVVITVNSSIQDMDYDRVVSVGDFWQHLFSNGLVACGIIQQLHLDPVFSDGYDANGDGKVQASEFQAWARWFTGDTWNISLNNPAIISIVYDLNNNGRVDIGDRYRHYSMSTGFIKRGDINQDHIDQVLNNGYDVNDDGYVQIAEFQASANGITNDTWTITLQPTEVRSVICYIYDQDNNYTVSAGDSYYNRYYSGMSLRETNRGKIYQTEIDDAIAKGFDSDADGLISTTEYNNYKTAQDVHSWAVFLQNAPATVTADYYSFIYDADGDGTTEVEVGDHFLHQSANGEIYAEGTIDQGHINWVLTAHDLNHDGKVQVGELQAAAADLTGSSWYIQMAPATIDTTDYWPISTGNYWEYYRHDNNHPEYASYRTRIEIETDQYGAQAAYFTKNHIDTYWGFGWDPDEPYGPLHGNHPDSSVEKGVFLKWYIQWNNDWMVSNNSRGNYTTYNDDKHDDIRYRGSDGKYVERIWWVQNTAYAPYCLWPRILNLSNTHVESNQWYRGIAHDGAYWNTGAGWNIDYKWAYVKTDVGYEGRALRVQFYEPIPGNGYVVEDWYLVPNYGVVKIEQYKGTNRLETDLIVRIEADKLVLKPHATDDMGLDIPNPFSYP